MRLSSILTKNIQKFYYIGMTTRAMNLIFIALIADKNFDYFSELYSLMLYLKKE